MATTPSRTRSIDGIRPRQGTTPRSTSSMRLARLLARRRWQLVVAGIGILLVGAALLGLLLMHKHSANTANLDNVTAVKAKVASHYLLPADEEPALATVTDKSRLNTPFLKTADNGDKILIYQQNHLAIIYRPSIDRIVSVGPVTIDAPPQATQPQANNQ